MKIFKSLFGILLIINFFILLKLYSFILWPIYILTLLLPSLFLNIYIALCNVIVGLAIRMCAAYFVLLFNMKINLSGDIINGKERSLVILNHRTRLDWFYFYLLASLYNFSNRFRVVAKDDIRCAPIYSLVGQILPMIYLTRKFEKDVIHIDTMLQEYNRENGPLHCLIFPEGTDFRPKSVIVSNKFALANNLQPYHYVLHPRSKGFVKFVKELAPTFDAVYDISVAYSKVIPQKETTIVKGEFPDTHWHIKRYSMKELSAKSEKELDNWLNLQWKVKENLLESFYSKNGSFPKSREMFIPIMKNILAILLSWSCIALDIYLILTFYWFRWTLLVALILTILPFFYHGNDRILPVPKQHIK